MRAAGAGVVQAPGAIPGNVRPVSASVMPGPEDQLSTFAVEEFFEESCPQSGDSTGHSQDIKETH